MSAPSYEERVARSGKPEHRPAGEAYPLVGVFLRASVTSGVQVLDVDVRSATFDEHGVGLSIRMVHPGKVSISKGTVSWTNVGVENALESVCETQNGVEAAVWCHEQDRDGAVQSVLAKMAEVVHNRVRSFERLIDLMDEAAPKKKNTPRP